MPPKRQQAQEVKQQVEEETPQTDEAPSPAREVTSSPPMTMREEAVRAHNERTGGGEVREGELQEQLEAHNARTGGVAA